MDPFSYRYGLTGFVELYDDRAEKYSEFNQLYWLKEFSILFYLWQFTTDNIIKYQSSAIAHKIDARNNVPNTYYKWTMKRYPTTLHERKFYRDTDVIQFLLDMTSALAFLHSKSIIHRDVKPQNIALTDENRAVLLDFSHSHKMDIPLHYLDPQVVTYYYRAPEIFAYQDAGEPTYSYPVDIWALGSVLIEILTGKCFANYYTGGINDHERGELLYRAFTRNHKILYMSMKEYFIARKREGFVHYKQYWAWISKMIAPDPARRATAAELYEEVMTFAKMNNIGFILPVNGTVSAIMIEPAKLIGNCDEKLMAKCTEYLMMVRVNLRMIFNLNKMNEILNVLIQSQEITNENYKEKCAALAIIVETVLFDNIRDMEHYGTLNNKAVKDAIISIVQKFDQHLFGNSSVFCSEVMQSREI